MRFGFNQRHNIKSIITNEMVHSQTYKFYLVPLLFSVYIIVFPYCYQQLNFILSFILLVFPGAFIYSWICYLIHETWHKYLTNIPNFFLFNLYSWLLASDPQIYRICHGTHHTHTHTWDDMEFYPLGNIKNKYLRRLFNSMRFLFGQLFVYNIAFYAISKHAKFRWHKTFMAWLIIIMIYGIFFFISHAMLHVAPKNIVISWLLITFMGGSIQHHSQLIEHWGIIAEDKSCHERNLLSRNLQNKSMVERFFLFLTHWDSHQHVLHHTHVGKYTRPFLNAIPMPSTSVYISFKDYLKIAWRMITN